MTEQDYRKAMERFAPDPGLRARTRAAVEALLKGKLDYNPDVRCDHHGEHHGGDCGSHGCGEHTCG